MKDKVVNQSLRKLLKDGTELQPIITEENHNK